MATAPKGLLSRAKLFLFQNGRSHAVRLPKEFRFKGKEVSIRREGTLSFSNRSRRVPWPRVDWERLRELRLDFEVEPMRPELEQVDLDRS